MTIDHKEMEALLLEVLSMQNDLGSFLRSKSDDPTTLALVLHTACNLILDDYDDGSPVLSVFHDVAPRLDAIVHLGHKSVLKTLEDGSYDRIFSVSVEIATLEQAEEMKNDYTEIDGIEVKEVDERDIN